MIRLLSKADHLQAKSSRGGAGWRPTNLMYDSPDPADELSQLEGEALGRELRRQILVTLPWILMVLAVIGICAWGIAMVFRGSV